jgi:membrane-bound serine protease (ClpP class)
MEVTIAMRAVASGPESNARIAPTRSARSMIALLLFVAGLMLLPLPALAQDERPRVMVGEIDDTITPVMARYVERVIDDAESDGASAVVFEMDTPGGLSSAMDDIIRDILESEVPVVMYVTPRGARAASAGVYISYAAHVSAMAPGTNIGSASPVFMGAGEDVDDTMTQKVTNDAVAQIVNLANLRGRNAEWAEEAVREAANITADEALDLNVIDVIAPDLTTLLEEIDGRTVQMATGTATVNTAGARTSNNGMNWIERILQLLADPTIAYLFLSLGLLGIFFELASPGAIIPAVVGVVGVLLGLFGLGTLPVNWTGVLLILLAFGLFVADIFVPSLGLLTLGGLVSFIFGSYMLIDTDEAPGFEISRVAIWTMAVCFVAFFGLIGFLIVRSRRRQPAVGDRALIGELASVREALDPNGMVFAFGENWSASLEPGGGVTFVPVGATVVVMSVEGLRLLVRPATAQEQIRGASIVVTPEPDDERGAPESTAPAGV